MHSSGMLRRLAQRDPGKRECSFVLLRLLNPLFAIALKRKNTLRRILCSRPATLSSSRRCADDMSGLKDIYVSKVWRDFEDETFCVNFALVNRRVNHCKK